MRASASILALALCGLGLAGCGLTGPLDRPEPIIGASEPEPEVEIKTVEVEKPAPRPTTNALGGELPAAAPVKKVSEEGLPPPKKDGEGQND